MGQKAHGKNEALNRDSADYWRKKRVHLYIYEGLVGEVRKRGYNLSQVVNMILAAIVSQEDALSRLQKQILVRWPGFEPGLPAWKAGVLDQARLPPLWKNGGARGI